MAERVMAVGRRAPFSLAVMWGAPLLRSAKIRRVTAHRPALVAEGRSSLKVGDER